MEKKQCGICWNDINKFNIVKTGCCSFVSCVDCVKQLKKCPQCKTQYFWTEISNDEVCELKMQLAITNVAMSNLQDELESTKSSLENFNSERQWWASRVDKLKEELKKKNIDEPEIETISFENTDDTASEINVELPNYFLHP
jgi:hypothetical protein